MSGSERRYFSGDTLEMALMRAARFHEVDPDRLAWTKVEKKHGFLKARRGVVIEIDPQAPLKPAGEVPPVSPPDEVPPVSQQAPREAPREALDEVPPVSQPAPREAPDEVPPVSPAPFAPPAEEAPAAAPVPPPAPAWSEPARSTRAADSAPPPSAVEDSGPFATEDLGPLEPVRPARRPAAGEATAAAHEALAVVLEVGGLELEARIEEGEEGLEVELTGPDQARLLEDRGRLLLSIQHLLPRGLRGVMGRSMHCRVDSQNFQELRKQELRELAERTAGEVARQGRPRTLEPMAPDERRIVHLALAEDPAVATESLGRGFFKRVKIRPARERPRGFDPYNR